MKVAIIGYAIDGQSAYAYWKKQGADITICDQNEALVLPTDVATRQGESYLRDLNQFDLIVRSSGIHPDVIRAANPDLRVPVTTVVDEFLRVCPTRNVIGVTGSKGKGTTTTLIATMLEAAGKHVFLGGNIGVSPLDFLEEITPESWVVLELSSFQLYDIRHSPHIGVCLKITPEHLNWHSDMDDYTRAKSNMFTHQAPHDIAIYFADDPLSHRIASASPGAKIAYFAEPGAYVADGYILIDDQRICHVDEIKLRGKHNWQNACAAATAVWQVVPDIAPIRAVLTLFGGLEHRIEFVREVDGVQYFDDSFGTTPQTAIVAVEAFTEPKVLILGGSSKQVPFDSLAKVIAHSNVRRVIVIGDTAPLIEAALKAEGYDAITPGGTTMTEIVQAARGAAKSGDVVLLSPACASFGLFKDYKDRGYQFKLAVGKL